MPVVDTDVLEREEVGSSGCMLVPHHRNQSEPVEVAKFWPRRTRGRYSGCYSSVVNGALEIEAHDIHAEACGDEQPAKVQEVSDQVSCRPHAWKDSRSSTMIKIASFKVKRGARARCWARGRPVRGSHPSSFDLHGTFGAVRSQGIRMLAL